MLYSNNHNLLQVPLRMNTVFAQFARVSVILLMLFTQSAVLEHAIEHTAAEHTEHCAVFATADNTTACGIDLISMDAIHFTYKWIKSGYQFVVQISQVNNYLSRAPPYLFTV